MRVTGRVRPGGSEPVMNVPYAGFDRLPYWSVVTTLYWYSVSAFRRTMVKSLTGCRSVGFELMYSGSSGSK